MQKNNNDLFYTCSLIEFIGRQTHNHRGDVVNRLGEDLPRIYHYADVFHCEPIAKTADDFIRRNAIPQGDYDNIAKARYLIPDCWDIGAVFARIIEDNYEEENVIRGIREVFTSWMADHILNFNTDLYYQSREYLAACYREGSILVA